MKKSLFGISLLTITCLYCLLAAVLILVAMFTKIPVIYGVGASIVILIIQFLISPFITDLTMRWFYKVKFNYEIPEYLKKFIEETCKNHKMKYPKVGFIDDGAPNAFTYGHTKNNARVVLTRGIFELLNEEEVKAVVAHELGHASHYDMLFMTVAQLVPLVLYGIYELLRSKDNSDSDSKAQMVAWIAYILYIISNYIILALSRTREYYADSFSLEETKNPSALASALVKIGFGLSTAETNEKHSAARSNTLGIFDVKSSKSLVVGSTDEKGEVNKEHIKQAMKWEKWNIWAKWYQLNSTHPLISKRLEAISKRCPEFNQKPYIEFDLKKEESYVDDFIVELIINFIPTIILIATIILVAISEKIKISTGLIIGVGLLVFIITSFIKFSRRYKNKNYKETTVRDLLGEVKVSHITSIPCTLEGTVIGRGNPGCIFNEDFVIKDKTGIIFLDYNQPINLANKIFALFKTKEYFDKTIKIKGWYRRSPVPYVEIKEYEVDGKNKKIWTYPLAKALYIIGAVISVAIIAISVL
jgi:heat shock protein HtpX